MRMGNGAVPIPPLTVVAIMIGLSLLQARERGAFRDDCAPDDRTRVVLEEAVAALDTARLYRPNLPLASRNTGRSATPTRPTRIPTR